MFSQAIRLVGLLTIISTLFRLFRFARHFLTPSALPRYLHGKEPWAVVTGASDGIGYGYVEELATRGFNIVLHGRNAAKLNDRTKQLQIKYPQRQFRTAVLDSSTATPQQIEALATALPNGVTVLINNVGAGSMNPTQRFSKFLQRSVSDISGTMTVNEIFPTLLTRALLPSLIANQPALIVNIGSGLDSWPCAYLEDYCGAKAHNRAFSHALRLYMQIESHDVEVMYHRVIAASTPGSGEPVSFATVTPRVMAGAALERVGCKEGETFGPMRHAGVVGVFEGLVPDGKWILGKMVSRMVEKKL